MTQPSLFEGAGAAPATAPRQAPRERTQVSAGQEPCQNAIAPHTDRESSQVQTDAPEGNQASIPHTTVTQTIALDGREYRLHRDCGEFVWLAALDAGIAGPFYRVRASVIAQTAQTAQPSSDERAVRIKAAQARLAACAPNDREYDLALSGMLAAMKEGRG